MVNPGARVGAISHTTPDNKVHFYGWGTYVGDETGGPMGDWPNPKIQLDDGGIVWGCECWWGAEERVRKAIGIREVVIVPPPDRTTHSADNNGRRDT